MSKNLNVIIHSDGACSGNPGPGGWASILKFGSAEKVLKGGNPDTTNNRMELQAVVEGLKALSKPCNVVIKSDSRYVITSMMIYMYDWEKRGWKKSNGESIAHVDLWKQMFELVQKHKVLPLWVKGHSDDSFNNRADILAKSAVPIQ